MRGFALIVLGAGVVFALISLYFQWDVADEWVITLVILLALFVLGRFIPRGSLIATLGWLLYFPLLFFLIAGTRYIATLPPVEPHNRLACTQRFTLREDSVVFMGSHTLYFCLGYCGC